MCSRRFQTLRQMFQELNRASPKHPYREERRPVLLLLGGGMAAGKSTVREIIGQDNFWTKVRHTESVYAESLSLPNVQSFGGDASESCCCCMLGRTAL